MTKKELPLVHIDYNLVDTAFDSLTDFNGDLVFDYSLKINGKFKGSIKTEGFLYIGEKAVVEADIEAGIVILGGTVKGDILAKDKIEMLPSGKLYGNLETSKLKISDGVVFEGKCKMIKKKPQEIVVEKKPEPKPVEKTPVNI
ncbi:MAG: polymer-forming cytoskeletal protein [Spirochaetes bacterium]|nr:polymer-forming cytoskeletal protein [Spirochaetota bacterium]